MNLPTPLEKLIGELAKFPGIGRRSAERMAFDLVADRSERLQELVTALRRIDDEIGLCEECGYFATNGRCAVCGEARSHDAILVVERPLDVVAVEKAGGYHGFYHVLGGHLSPLKGVTPDDLSLDKLFQRLRNDAIRELILATSPTVEGDATALYISRHLPRTDLRVTRLGRGMPMGGSLEFTDAGTLRLALEGRQTLESR